VANVMASRFSQSLQVGVMRREIVSVSALQNTSRFRVTCTCSLKMSLMVAVARKS
jgi:hypothetical protein